MNNRRLHITADKREIKDFPKFSWATSFIPIRCSKCLSICESEKWTIR